MSEFLAPNNDALTQTMTIRGKMDEEKKNKGFDSTSRSMISDIKRSNSRPVTPLKSNSKIPFLDNSYMKSPMRTRNRISRSPYDGNTENNNDFQNDDQSQFDHSIIFNKSQIDEDAEPPQFGGKIEDSSTSFPKSSFKKEGQPEIEKPTEKASKKEAKPTQAIQDVIPPPAFNKIDLIPRTPPQVKSKKYSNPPPEESKEKKKQKAKAKAKK